MNAILGRDFLNKKGFKIKFKNNIVDIVELDRSAAAGGSSRGL